VLRLAAVSCHALVRESNERHREVRLAGKVKQESRILLTGTGNKIYPLLATWGDFLTNAVKGISLSCAHYSDNQPANLVLTVKSWGAVFLAPDSGAVTALSFKRTNKQTRKP
jgi:hypothetical protein